MASFEYQARTDKGEMRSGFIETSSKEAAIDFLQQQKLIVVSVKEFGKKSFLEFEIGGGVKQKDIAVFSRQLSTLFEAQIPVVEALKTLLGETGKSALRGPIAEILDDITGGMSLSQAIAKHPKVFSTFYLNLVRSGEESGKLQEIFSYLADYLERSYYLNTKARNALIYPAFILVAFVAVFVILLVIVIPRLITIFEETGQAIPIYTQAIIILSTFLRDWGFVILFFLIGGAVILWRWSLTINGKYFFHKLLISLPVIGEMYRKLYMARLSNNLRTLLVGGIPIIRALSISADVVGNMVYQKAIEDAIESVKGGGTISASFEKTPEIPVLVTQMIKIGESSGRLDFILESMSKFYQREVDSTIENLVALIEPSLIVFLGIAVGILVGSILVPLYNLVGSL